MALKDDEFDIGGSGIDTQYERDYINYRPKIEYTQPKGNSSQGLSVDTSIQSQGMLADISGSSAAALWEAVVDTVTSINKLEKTLNDKLQNVSVPIPVFSQSTIQKAAEELGVKGITDSIPFSLYKKTFENPSAPNVILIQDVYEDYMADVDGNLNGEIYTDVAEMQNDWTDMQDFIQKGLFAQLVSVDEAPNDISADDSKMDGIKQAETQLENEYAQLLMILDVNKEIYYSIPPSDYDTKQYYDALGQYEDVKHQIENLEKKLFTKAEVVDLVSRKASDTTDAISLLSNTVDFDPFEDDKYELLYGLLKQFPTRLAMVDAFKKMKALLKLSVDGKKTDTKSMREVLRGMAGRSNKKKVNKMLINGVHLRNEISNSVYSIMNTLGGIPNNENFDIISGHISDGVRQAENMYHQQASDFYKMHAMDTNVRRGKVASLIDKDAARSTYKLLGMAVDYTQNVNTTWPDEANLSTWLKDFMSYYNIN